VIDSPVGPLTLVVDDAGALAYIFFDGQLLHDDAVTDPQACAAAARQLDEYFRGKRREFTLPLSPRGTEFQLAVWNELCRIPFGATISYADLARRIGRPNAVRAVGAANGANPIPIVIPCHRVIGSNGSLTGYGGGLPLKQKLLSIEGAQCSFL
jgi:methylated-DNA-[protein]-cysteine S-methyltransferase